MLGLLKRVAFFCMFANKKTTMKLIIDCGSTKADWVILNGNNIVSSFNTEGFNPNYTDKNAISSIVLNNISYQDYIQYITDVYFYGTGCGNHENCTIIKDIFQSIFVNAKIYVTHDMMAACHALLGNKEGVACILGTGSNSCHYDGKEIISKAVSLGYIVGDEGSGNHIGKQLLRDYFYKKMPSELSDKFEKEHDADISSVIDNLYHKTQASKYLASFSKFAYENKENEYIKSICSRCFDEFIECFILRYGMSKDTKIGFVGSIAYYFQDLLSERLENHGLGIGNIIKNPIEGLIEYHLQN